MNECISPDGRHNFVSDGHCAFGCGNYQDGRQIKKMASVSPMEALMNLKIPKKSTKMHSELHLLVDELRKEFGETAVKGRGSFGYYLGYFKRVGVPRIHRLKAELKQSVGNIPKRLFWWHIGKILKERKENPTTITE